MISPYLFSIVAAEDFVTMFPVSITLLPNTPPFLCTTLIINDDSITEARELFIMELELVDTELANQVSITRNQVRILIQDNDRG